MTNKVTSWVKENKTGLIIIAITWLIFFSRTLFGGQVYFLDDLKVIYYPLEHAYAEFQTNLELPEWSPYFGFGHPLLAWGQLGFFAPLHVLLRLFQAHPLVLLQISILSYYALGMTGMFVFLKKCKLDQISASVGAVIFAFCGFHVGHLNHVNFYTASMWLPWLMLAITTFLSKPTAVRAATLSIVAAVIPLSGQPQISLYTFIIAAIFGATYLVSKRNFSREYLTRAIGYTALAGVVAFCIASLAILPLFEFLPLTDRAASLTKAELYEFSYPAEHLITLINPYYFGDHEFYWGAKNFQELAAYVGVLPLLLAVGSVLVLIVRKTKNPFTPLRMFSLVLVLVAAVLAPGKHSPIYTYLVENNILTSLAIPGRFVYFFDVGLALLAAIGLYDLIQVIKKASIKQAMALTVAIVTAINLIYVGWNYNPLTPKEIAFAKSSIAPTLQAYTDRTGLPPRLYSRSDIYLNQPSITPGKPTTFISPDFYVFQPIALTEKEPCLLIPMHNGSDEVSHPLTISLHREVLGAPIQSFEIQSGAIPSSRPFRMCINAEGLVNEPLYLSFTSKEETNVNLYLVPNQTPELDVYLFRVKEPTPEQVEESKKAFRIDIYPDRGDEIDREAELLARHMQVTANTSSSRWIGALAVHAYRFFANEFLASEADTLVDADGTHQFEHRRNLLNMAGVTHLAQIVPEGRDDLVPELGFTLVESHDILEDLNTRIYENPQAFDKVFLVPNAQWQPANDEVIAALTHREYDPGQQVLLGGETPPPFELTKNAPPVEGSASITSYEPTKVEISAQTDQGTWLILNDTYTPQWHAKLDGQDTPIYSANAAFRAVFLPAGEHSITFYYHSPATQKAKILTIIGLGAVLGIYLFHYLKSRASSSVASSPPSTS